MPFKLSGGEYLGQVVKRREVAGLFFTETSYAPGARLPKHCHANAYLSLARHGRYTETYGRRTRTCAPLTLVYHPAGEVHAQEFHDEPARSFNIELDAGWLRRVQDFAGGLAGGQEFQGGTAAALALKLYQEFHLTDDVAPLVIEGLALELVGELSRKARPSRRRKLMPVWVVRAWDLIDAKFTDPLRVEDIATEVGVHPIHLSCVFRQTYRCTIGERVRRLRVEFAAEQLSGTDLPLATIAQQAGFCSLSHLSVYFKKLMGLTPSAFRRSLRPSG
jgi:AraC family transcriptional regulator